MKRHAIGPMILLGSLCVGGCSSDEENDAADAAQQTAALREEDNEEDFAQIECAIGEGSNFAPDCYVDSTVQDGKNVLIVRQPGGTFRRFIKLDDGRGLEVADGADQAQLSMDGDMLEVTVGDDRYKFPATVEGGDAQAASGEAAPATAAE